MRYRVTAALPVKAARMLAVEMLLAEPEALGDDVRKSCLYPAILPALTPSTR
jgi:hypothetical protein